MLRWKCDFQRVKPEHLCEQFSFEIFTAVLLKAIKDRVPVWGGDASEFHELLGYENSILRLNYPSHITTSSIIFHPVEEKVLLFHHKKIGEWVYPGGHADGDWYWLRSAVRECFEETGISEIDVVLPSASDNCIYKMNDPAALLPWIVHKFPRAPSYDGEPAHFHFDVIYVFRACGSDFILNTKEGSAMRWFKRSELNSIVEAGEDSQNGVSLLTATLITKIWDACCPPFFSPIDSTSNFVLVS
jgi:8-oxo-dGTP pyrophosphatase MutT (NUDIX family)